ncbi:MAG TPA: tRNA (adenosine(37)-N6)-dimethylallyltransferase MiaA [Tichowtungia sp.]|nr:tRNA (adenosine(37)-N6)-dimethylallyltransferase MiaA [Tichowtungia sp.]
MSNPLQAYIIVGPTASGKSAVAQLLAEQTGASLVSADSMNIYRGMDIGTAKPSPADRRNVPTFGIDLADPTETFSVGNWLNAVKPVFFHCLDSPTIVAGGTGLYVKCLLAGLDDLPPADEELRERAEKMTLAELQAEAKAAAPEAYEALADKENPRRIIRLIEKSQGVKKNHTCAGGVGLDLPKIIGLHVERAVLHKRIAARVDQMYAGGLIEEARGLAEIQLSSTAQHAIGYAEAFAVLRGEMSEADAKEKTVVRTRRLAKRQMTWFRNQLNVEWIETADVPTIGKLAEKVFNVWTPVPVAL